MVKAMGQVQCWSCKAYGMELKTDDVGHPYRQCPKCGATDTNIEEGENTTIFKKEE